MNYSNCWAFTALGSLEGRIRKKYNRTVHLSVQQLTDCSSNDNYGNMGCKGGKFGMHIVTFMKTESLKIQLIVSLLE